MTNITHSSIIECKINEYIIDKKTLHYKSILIHIWKYMPSQKICQNTKFHIKSTNVSENGFKWCPELNMSIQNKDAKNTLPEIIKFIKLNNFTIDISIELETKKIINFKIE